MKTIDDYTLQELKSELIVNGLDEKTAKAFISKAQAFTVLGILKEKKLNEKTAKEIAEAQPKEVEKVKTIEELKNPKEERTVEKSWRSKAQIMMNIWLSEPMMSLMVPSEPGRQPGKVEWRKNKQGESYQIALTTEDTIKSIQVNGAKWLIPRGVYVEVPTRVAKKIAKELEMTNNAGKQWLIDRNDEKTGQPVGDAL